MPSIPELLARRPGRDLPLERLRDRLSAYVYGNILVLSAIATVSPSMVESGYGLVLVAATTVTTYLSHVVAHAVGGSLGETSAAAGRHHLRAELRDAVPIVSSGSVPVLVLALGWWGVLAPGPAVLLSALVVVVRLAGLGVQVSRLSGRAASATQLAAGVALAVVAAVVVGLKVWLLH